MLYTRTFFFCYHHACVSSKKWLTKRFDSSSKKKNTWPVFPKHFIYKPLTIHLKVTFIISNLTHSDNSALRWIVHTEQVASIWYRLSVDCSFFRRIFNGKKHGYQSTDYYVVVCSVIFSFCISQGHIIFHRQSWMSNLEPKQRIKWHIGVLTYLCFYESATKNKTLKTLKLTRERDSRNCFRWCFSFFEILCYISQQFGNKRYLLCTLPFLRSKHHAAAKQS